MLGERKEPEEVVSTPLLEQGLDAVPLALLLHEGGRVVFLNRAGETLWGVKKARARGRNLLEVVRKHQIERLAIEGGYLELEVGERFLVCTAEVSSVGGTLTVEDRSEAKKREQELHEVMAVLSHEFRTPVTAVLGVLEALEYELPPELQRSFVQQGLSEMGRLRRLVEDMTVGFRISVKRPFRLLEVTKRAEKLLAVELERRGATLELPSGEIEVLADIDKLLQVLLNLFENALRHGPEGATVKLEVQDFNVYVVLRVIDEGGPLPDYVGIFGARERGKGAKGVGSGMGLYIIKTIVEGWGGSVSAAHEMGVGNVFSVTLPR